MSALFNEPTQVTQVTSVINLCEGGKTSSLNNNYNNDKNEEKRIELKKGIVLLRLL